MTKAAGQKKKGLYFNSVLIYTAIKVKSNRGKRKTSPDLLNYSVFLLAGNNSYRIVSVTGKIIEIAVEVATE